MVRASMAENQRQLPDFLTLSPTEVPEGIVGRMPDGKDISIPVQTQLIVELCSR